MLNLPPIDTSDRRRAERRSALDVNICLVDLGQGRSAMLLDVSETGIGVQTVEGPGEGLYASFKFTLPDTEVVIVGEAEIAWADRAGRMGLRFTNLAEEMRNEIRKWCTSEANPLFSDAPVTDEIADLDARDRVAQLEARIIVSGWAQIQALNFLVDQIAAMTQASGVAIAVEDGGGIVCKASSGIAPQVGVRVDPRSGLSWECVRTREVVQCVDTETDPRVDRIVCRQLNMRSAMLVPVMKKGRVAGLVEVFSSRAHAFNNQTVILLRRVGEAVASLDETAPNVSQEEPLIPKPDFASPVPPPMTGPVAVPSAPVTSTPLAYPPAPAPAVAHAPVVAAPPVATPAPARVAVAPAPQPAPKHVPSAAAPATKPAPAVVPAAEPRPVPPPERRETTPATAAPVVIESSAVPKPALVPEPPPKVETRAVVVPTPAVSAPPVQKREVPPAVIAPPAPVFKPVENRQETKPPVEIRKAPPAVAERPAPVPVVFEPKPKKTVDDAPAAKVAEKAKPAAAVAPAQIPARKATEHRAPARPAPSPVAFSGAAAAPKPARTEAPRPATAPQVDEPEEEELPSVFSQVGQESAFNNKRIGIGAAAVVLVGALGYGAWYMARPRVVYEAAAQPAATAKTETPASAPVAPSVPAATGSTSTSSATTTAAPKASAKTPAAPALTTPDDTTRTIQAQRAAKAEPVVVVPSSTERAQKDSDLAPPVPIAPPNTVGMASILANPVPQPALVPQRISQGVSGGKQLRRVQPLYPPAARSMRLTGTVTVRAHVDRSGNVTVVQIVKGHPLLNPAAMDAVRRWKYSPFLLNGQAIENDINVDVRFDLPQ